MEQEQGHELAIWAVQVCFQAIPRTQKSAMMQSVSIFISFGLSTGNKAFLDSFYTLSGPPEFSSWGSWSSCTKTCGRGTRTGTRTCTSYCDTLDPSKTTETITEDCNERSCEFKIFSRYKAFLDSFYTLSGPPKFSSWGSWSSCTTACGHGTRTRTRKCTSYCDTLNPSKTTETITEDCYERSCEFKIFSSDSSWANI